MTFRDLPASIVFLLSAGVCYIRDVSTEKCNTFYSEQFNSFNKVQLNKTSSFIEFTSKSMGERLLTGEGTIQINYISEKTNPNSIVGDLQKLQPLSSLHDRQADLQF